MANVRKNLDRLSKAAQRPPEKKTPEQIERDVWLWLHYMLDPVAFCREALRFNPDPWQCDLLRSKSPKIFVNVARQQGKSETSAAKVVHRAVFYPRSLILLVAPAVPQAGELRRKIDNHLRNCKVSAQTVSDNKRELELENGSRIIIVAADEDTVRSYTAHMIIEDESSLVPENVHQAMRPMLRTTKGQHILLGTPKGIRKHHFPDIWHDEESSWEKYMVTAWENTRIPNNKAQLEEEREEMARLGRLWWFQQEYECSFVAAAQGLVYPFDRKKNLLPMSIQRDPRAWQYVLGIDYGFTDSTAYVVLGWQQDDPNVYVIESFDKKGLLAPEAAQLALELTKKYPFARIVGDMSGFGKGYVEEARRRFKLPIQAADKNNKRGYIELMASDLKAGLLKLFPGNDGLIDEWSKLPWDEEREMPAEGYKDHLADAALYAWRAACHFLEEVRKAPPKKGSKEAFVAEATGLFNARIVEVRRPETYRRLVEARSRGYISQEQLWAEFAEQAESIEQQGRSQPGLYDEEEGFAGWLEPERMNETTFLN